ncbi:MAG: regulatory iron-sulfur-containing complex subunit RicT [Bacteroidota bacterium]
MGCSSCSTKHADGTPAGCKSNGACGNGGCNKLTVFDWLANMELPAGQKAFDIVEVRFKNSRKQFFKNIYGLTLQVGDVVAVEGSPGYDVGVVSIVGELVKLQLNRKDVRQDSEEVKKILRKASQKDISTWQESRLAEDDTMYRARKIASELNLKMKISDVEYQGDKVKATFYYTADDRVDFRELIKKLADEFRIRIEMRQIGARQEAARVGGIGSCGRELCCTTWLNDFRTVTTGAARYQQLSLNPQKLAGQCGKLKCCLNYELDMYMEAVKEFPDPDVKLRTKRGTAAHFKTDIFKRMIWYVYEDEHGINPIGLEISKVKEIIEKNKNNQFPEDLKDFEFISPQQRAAAMEPDYANVDGQDSLTRFDKKKGNDKRGGRNKNNRDRGDRKDGPDNRNKPNTPGGGNRNPQGAEGKSQPGGNRNPNNRQPRENRPQGDKPEGGNTPRPQNQQRQQNQRQPQQNQNPEGGQAPQQDGEQRTRSNNNRNRNRGNRRPNNNDNKDQQNG